MNNSLDLTATRSLKLLAQMRETFAVYAQKEEKLTRDFAAQRHAVNRSTREQSGRLESTWASRITEAEAMLDRQEAAIREWHEARRARIQKFHAKMVRTLPQRAKDAKGKLLARLQMREISAERAKESGLAAAEKEASAFAERLGRRKADIANIRHTAHRSFQGYGSFVKMLEAGLKEEKALPKGEHLKIYDELRGHIEVAAQRLGEFQKLGLPRFFKVMQLALLLPLAAGGAVAAGYLLGNYPASWGIAGGGFAVLAILLCVLHGIGRKAGEPLVQALAEALGGANRALAGCTAAADRHHQDLREKVEHEYATENKLISERWQWAGTVEKEFENKENAKLEEQGPRLLARNEAMARPRLKELEEARKIRLSRLRADADAERATLSANHEKQIADINEAERTAWAALEAAWLKDTAALSSAVADMSEALAVQAWDASLVESWKAPQTFATAARFGELHLSDDSSAQPKRLVAQTSMPSKLPVALTFPAQGCLLLETSDSGGADAMGTLENMILRILDSMPPGKATFTIFDPVGLGQGFAGLMHLADYEDAIINRRIWTQRDQIEERLADLNEHIEKVIQMYLRNEYATITQYNEQAGSVAEKYHFLVLADFPANFTDVSVKRLQSIIASGPRCGVFTLIHWDRRQPLPDGFVPDELRKHSVCIRPENGRLALPGQAGASLVLDPPPSADVAAALVHRIGRASVDSNRVQVPFSQIAPKPDEMWTGDTTQELKVPIGRTGATKQQMLAIGKGTRQHGLIAGKTGSGKSTLFHVIITNLALSCSPQQVEFYLIDFKKGVEFKCYATQRLPHARVIAIESDREFGLSVLQRVDDELKRRGDIFRKLGVQDIPGYKRVGGTEPMPRVLLMIDEFQEFFVEDDSVAQGASLLFDRIVRQGRAFGIHVLLGSQTLGGAYTLARATLGQMAIRVALQCNEADAHLIMDENNSAPRLLSRPGEGIYNDASGALEGNSPFQVVWLADEEREDWLAKVRALADLKGDQSPGAIVFEGNAPADVRENHLLSRVLAVRPETAPAAPRFWLGAPNSIKGPTEVVFHRQGGNHLLVVGQRDEAVATMFGLAALALAAQYPEGAVKVVLLLGGTPGSAESVFIERMAAQAGGAVSIVRPNEAADTIVELGEDLKQRIAGESPNAPATFVLIHGLHRFKKLKMDDDFDFGSSDSGPSAGTVMNELIQEGSSNGIHLVVSTDSFSNVSRFMTRKAIGEFELRVVFQMSANDSASLIDSPKASTLGLHRAILYNEHEGTIETFRPYATPEGDLIA